MLSQLPFSCLTALSFPRLTLTIAELHESSLSPSRPWLCSWRLLAYASQTTARHGWQHLHAPHSAFVRNLSDITAGLLQMAQLWTVSQAGCTLHKSLFHNSGSVLFHSWFVWFLFTIFPVKGVETCRPTWGACTSLLKGKRQWWRQKSSSAVNKVTLTQHCLIPEACLSPLLPLSLMEGKLFKARVTYI